MGDGIAFLIGFPLVKWPVMVALLAACKFDTVRAAYTWLFIAIVGVLTASTAPGLLIFPFQSLAQDVSALAPILWSALFLVLLVAFDALFIGLQARRRFYRDADGILSWRAAWGLSVAGNLLTFLAIVVVSVLIWPPRA